MKIFLLSIVFLITPVVSLAGASDPIQHTHGERSHAHSLPESGTNHSHGLGNTVTISNKLRRSLALCNGGNMEACYDVGYAYKYGEDAKQDYSKAALFYRKACDGRNVPGCVNLARLYIEGLGVKQNYSKGAIFHSKACEWGNLHACYLLGGLYDNGKGLKQDYYRAALLYKKSCDGGPNYPNGHLGGCYDLALLYSSGKGVKQDKSEAKRLYGAICDAGNQRGCDKYRILNEQGIQ